ncbi:MAG: methyltransferase domain-containing protein [Pseudomonadota bacterium]
MQDRPLLFEETLLAVRRDRAVRLGYCGRGDFLARRAAHGLADRLSAVNRAFEQVAVFGTGGRAIAEALGRSARLYDPSPAMAAACGGAIWQGEALPVAEGSADLVISTLLLHWANDPVGQLVQMRRALRPDGLMLASLFGGRTLAELRASLAEAEAEVTGGLAARVAPMGDVRDLGGLLQRAGFAMPVADSDRVEVTYASPFALLQDLRAMGETSILARRRPLRRDVLGRAAELYAEHFPAPDGRVRATFEIVTLTGWAPAPDQPVAKRPGTATARLADALGAVEIPAGEKPNK